MTPELALSQTSSPPTYISYLPVGEVLYAFRDLKSPHPPSRKSPTPAQRAGLAYQRRVERVLVAEFGRGSVLSGPWYRYCDTSARVRWCQPDFLVVREDTTFVVEAKVRWTSDAWWQLNKLYLPVLKRAEAPVSSRVFVPVAATRSYDPAISVPEEIDLIYSLLEAQASRFSVLLVR